MSPTKEKIKKINQKMVLGINQNLAAKSPRLQHNEVDEDQLNAKEFIINLKNRTRTIALPKINIDKAKLN